jgi:hypothetical protein
MHRWQNHGRSRVAGSTRVIMAFYPIGSYGFWEIWIGVRWFNMRPGRAIRGLWRILDENDKSGLFSCSELWGSSPCLCQIRTVSVGSCGTSIDYVLLHTRFMGSHKLSSFDGLGGLACVVLSDFPLEGVYWFESPRHPRICVMAWCVVFECSNSTFIMLYLYYEMDVDYLVVNEMINMKTLLITLTCLV